MIIRLSEDAQSGMLRNISSLIDSGGKAGRIELISAAGSTLATLQFSYPCANEPTAGELNMREIKEDPAANNTGIAREARILASDGLLVFECDVSDEKGDAVIRLNSNEIKRGGPVRIKSFRISVPE